MCQQQQVRRLEGPFIDRRLPLESLVTVTNLKHSTQHNGKRAYIKEYGAERSAVRAAEALAPAKKRFSEMP